MNQFAQSSVKVAARLTDVPEQCCTVGAVVFTNVAVVDVVVSLRGIVLPTEQMSLREVLVEYGAACAVVSLLFGLPESLDRDGGDEDELKQLLPEVREGHDIELAQLYNQAASHTFLSIGRKDPVVPSQWAMFGGVILGNGIETRRCEVQQITIDRIWKLWQYGKWDCPEPAQVPVVERFAKRYEWISQDLGWCVLPT